MNCLRGLRPPPPRVQEKGRVAQPARIISFTRMGLNSGVPVPRHTGHHRPSATLTRSERFGRGRKKISPFLSWLPIVVSKSHCPHPSTTLYVTPGLDTPDGGGEQGVLSGLELPLDFGPTKGPYTQRRGAHWIPHDYVFPPLYTDSHITCKNCLCTGDRSCKGSKYNFYRSYMYEK